MQGREYALPLADYGMPDHRRDQQQYANELYSQPVTRNPQPPLPGAYALNEAVFKWWRNGADGPRAPSPMIAAAIKRIRRMMMHITADTFMAYLCNIVVVLNSVYGPGDVFAVSDYTAVKRASDKTVQPKSDAWIRGMLMPHLAAELVPLSVGGDRRLIMDDITYTGKQLQNIIASEPGKKVTMALTGATRRALLNIGKFYDREYVAADGELGSAVVYVECGDTFDFRQSSIDAVTVSKLVRMGGDEYDMEAMDVGSMADLARMARRARLVVFVGSPIRRSILGHTKDDVKYLEGNTDRETAMNMIIVDLIVMMLAGQDPETVWENALIWGDHKIPDIHTLNRTILRCPLPVPHVPVKGIKAGAHVIDYTDRVYMVSGMRMSQYDVQNIEAIGDSVWMFLLPMTEKAPTPYKKGAVYDDNDTAGSYSVYRRYARYWAEKRRYAARRLRDIVREDYYAEISFTEEEMIDYVQHVFDVVHVEGASLAAAILRAAFDAMELNHTTALSTTDARSEAIGRMTNVSIRFCEHCQHHISRISTTSVACGACAAAHYCSRYCASRHWYDAHHAQCEY